MSLGGLDVAVAVRVQDHLQAVVLLHDPPQLVGVLDVEVPGVGREHLVVGVGARLLVAEHGGQVHDVLGPHGGVRLSDGAEELLGVGPGLGLVQDAPAGAGDDLEAPLVHLLLQPCGLGREVAERAGLHDGEAGGRHLVQSDVPVDLLLVLREPDAPLVGADTDRQLAVARVGVAGLGLRHWRFLPRSVGASRTYAGHFVLSIDHENHTAPRPVRATGSAHPTVVPRSGRSDGRRPFGSGSAVEVVDDVPQVAPRLGEEAAVVGHDLELVPRRRPDAVVAQLEHERPRDGGEHR